MNGRLPGAELKHNTHRVADFILAVTKSLSGAAKIGAVKLAHDIFHLNRVDGDVARPLDVKASACGSSEGVLRVGMARRAAPGIGAAEQQT
jgi:hypothetical protein